MKSLLLTVQRALWLAVLCTVIANAQDFRGTITGLVRDANDAAVPNATVRATRIDTNVSTEVQTSSEGFYTIPYLVPATYTIEIVANGFKTVRREGVVVQVQDKLNLSFTLEPGQLTENVVVTGTQELIQTETASRGQVFDEVKTQELPLNGRQVYMLLNLTPGVVFTQEQFGATGFSGTRGWDTNGNYSFNGSQTGTSQFLLNGAPISTTGSWQFAPNAEAIQEFKVMTNTYDAQFGRSGGGTVNTTIKAGTNDWHGSAFNYHRNRVLDANSFQNKLNTRNNPKGEPRGPRITNQFGGTLGLPLRDDKDFLFLSYEGYREKVPFPILVSTVPLDLREGRNFSRYGITIYDPLTTRLCRNNIDVPGTCRSTYVRDPFPNNEIPANRISPIGRAILNLYPAPNYNPGGLNLNFIASGNTGLYHYDQPMGRWDHVFNERHRLHTIVTWQHGNEFRSNNGFPPPAEIGQIVSERTNQNYIADYTWVQSPTAVWNFRLSFGRFTSDFPDGERSFDFTYDKLGIKNMPVPPTVDRRTAPRITLSNYSDIIGNSFSWSTDNQWDFTASLRQTRGRHSLSYGAEYAYIGQGRGGPGRANGQLNFDQGWTRQYRDLGQGALDGYSIASLLLGYPGGGNIDWNDSFYRSWPYVAGYVQDDWKVTSKLTLNLGLRYDIQFPWVERFNRANAGFDFSQRHPNSDAIIAKWKELKTAYDRNNPRYPYPDPPAAIYGARQFASDEDRRIYDVDWSNIQPRLGVAWNFLPKIVLRGGFGIFHPTDGQSGQVSGFNQSTGYINSIDQFTPSAGLTGPYSLEDPFPNGLIRPAGNDASPFLLTGQGVSFDGNLRPIRRSFQYSFGFEFALPWASVLEVSYAGRYTNKLPMNYDFNGQALEDFSRAEADVNYFQLQVPNPFQGLFPDTVGLGRNANVARSQLLRPYPGYNNLTQFTNPWGKLRYDALQVRVEKRAFNSRAAGVLTFIMSYAWSKNLARTNRLNEFNLREEPVKQLADLDKTHTYAFSGVWDLPLGKGRRWFADRPGVVGALIDGWNLNWIHQYYSGYPVGKPDAIFSCASYKVPNPNEDAWFNNDRACYAQRPPNSLREVENRFAWIRNPNRPQLSLSLSRRIAITERYTLQIKGEAFNAFNTPIRPGPNTNFTSPDFGRLPRQQNNFPRNIQLSARFIF
jgi:hypothetical protein